MQLHRRRHPEFDEARVYEYPSHLREAIADMPAAPGVYIFHGEEGDLHRLRIALKKLRYTAEFLSPLYPRKKVRRYVKRLRGLQEQLGAINDIAHVRATMTAMLRETDGKRAHPGERYAAGLVTGWYRARRPRIAKQALKRWKQFRKIRPFWD